MLGLLTPSPTTESQKIMSSSSPESTLNPSSSEEEPPYEDEATSVAEEQVRDMTEKRLLKLSLPEKLESPAMDSVERKEFDVMVDMLLDVV